MPTAIAKLLASVVKAGLELLTFLLQHLRLTAGLIVLIAVVLLAQNVRDFLLLPIGIALLLWGARLRLAGH